MILGAGYLLFVDTLARSIAAVETPIGILTAFVGARFFCGSWRVASTAGHEARGAGPHCIWPNGARSLVSP
jgi:FecCD transport family